MPDIIRHFHFHQNVAGIKLFFCLDFLSAFHFQHFLCRYQNLADLIIQTKDTDAFAQSFHDFIFVTGVGVDYKPFLRHKSVFPYAILNKYLMSSPRPRSTRYKKMPKMKTAIITTIVVSRTSLKVGHVTFFISALTSTKKVLIFTPIFLVFSRPSCSLFAMTSFPVRSIVSD